MRGRKPKSTAQKKLEGNPGKRPINKDEPAMPAATVAFDDPPEELAKDNLAAAEWRRLAPLLRRSRTITEADRSCLVALCQQWSLYQDAMSKVPTAGMIVKAPSGYPMPNPYLGVANRAMANCQKLWVELGLTPSSRSRVTTIGGGGLDGPNDPFEDFLHDGTTASRH